MQVGCKKFLRTGLCNFVTHINEDHDMPGPMPKNPSTKQRRNKEPTAAQLIDTSPLTDSVPRLPENKEWMNEVQAWWDDVWKSPMASEYTQADVHGLLMLAELLQQFWLEPDSKLASEIRLQRQCFGLTPIDRRRLQWEIKRAEEPDRKPKPNRPERAGDPRSVLRQVK